MPEFFLHGLYKPFTLPTSVFGSNQPVKSNPPRSEAPMKKEIFVAILPVTLAIVGMSAYLALTPDGAPKDDASNDAYQDGSKLGSRDAIQAQRPHLALARWSTHSDRDAFVEGYKTAYEKTQSTQEQDSNLQQNSAAYCDGLYLGKIDAAQGREAHVAVGRWAQPQDREAFAAAYRRAYLEKIAALAIVDRPTAQASLVREAQN
jgi:hypothetical protein